MLEIFAKFIGGLMAVAAVLGLIWLVMEVVKVSHEIEQERVAAWVQFVKDHDCRIVSKTEDKSVPTTSFTTDGKVAFGSTKIKGSTGWLCNDVVTYYR